MRGAVSEQAVLAIVRRAEERFKAERHRLMAATDRMFGALMIGQWVFAIAIAVMYFQYAWEGKL